MFGDKTKRFSFFLYKCIYVYVSLSSCFLVYISFFPFLSFSCDLSCFILFILLRRDLLSELSYSFFFFWRGIPISKLSLSFFGKKIYSYCFLIIYNNNNASRAIKNNRRHEYLIDALAPVSRERNDEIYAFFPNKNLLCGDGPI